MPRVPAQPDLFATPEAAPEPVIWREEDLLPIRIRLNAILKRAEEADRLPWSPTTAAIHELTFQSETRWLPEGAELRERFFAQLDRLYALESPPPLPPA